MDLKFPATQAERRRGMAQFRAKLLAAHERLLEQGVAADYQRGAIACIKRAQQRFNDEQNLKGE